MRLTVLAASVIAAAATAVATISIFVPAPVAAGGGAARQADAPAIGQAAKAGPQGLDHDFGIARPILERADEIAVLEAVQIALSEVGDGAAYVWHAKNGRVSGVIRPTAAFRNPDGRICRNMLLAISAGSYSREREGIACREIDGVWHLEG